MGFGAWPTLLSLGLTLSKAALSIACAAPVRANVRLSYHALRFRCTQHGLMSPPARPYYRGLLQKDVMLWEYRRVTRRNIVFAQCLLTGAVEAWVRATA